jgi:Flp pilus assembly protein TadG
MKTTIVSLRKAKGNVLVLTVLVLLVLMGMAGLALDLSHAELNKTRLQNAVDSAALAGANVLNQHFASYSLTNPPSATEITAAKTAATNAINNVFSANVSANQQLNENITAHPTVEFSNTLFGSDTGTPWYVRVTSPTVGYSSWFMQVWGHDTTNVGTTAVAGITPVNCANNLVPIMLCAKPGGTQGVGSGGAPGNWGYNYNERIQLDSKFSGSQPTGNFMFLDTGGNNSADLLRDQLAGAGHVDGLCPGSTPTIVGTNPGNMTGPTADGINTRFGIYNGNYKNDAQAQQNFPPDNNQTCYDLALNSSTSHGNYTSGASSTTVDPNGTNNNFFCNANNRPAGGTPGNRRRELAVPIADCDGTHGGVTPGNGNTQVTVLDTGCLFLDIPADYPGKASYCSNVTTTPISAIPGCTANQQEISARFVIGCITPGFSSNNQNSLALKTVQLYKNPGSSDS